MKIHGNGCIMFSYKRMTNLSNKKCGIEMNNILPDDLKKYARKHLLIRLCSCIILLAILFTVLILFGDKIFNPEGSLYRIKEFICIALVIIICYFTGVPMRLIDRTFFGTIEKVTVTTGYNSRAIGKRQSTVNSKTASYRGFYSIITMEISIKTADGKHLKRTISSAPPSNDTNYDEIFKQGDRVFHLYGTDIYVKIPEDKKEKVACPVCGLLNAQSNVHCENCNHSIITN